MYASRTLMLVGLLASPAASISEDLNEQYFSAATDSSTVDTSVSPLTPRVDTIPIAIALVLEELSSSEELARELQKPPGENHVRGKIREVLDYHMITPEEAWLACKLLKYCQDGVSLGQLIQGVSCNRKHPGKHRYFNLSGLECKWFQFN